MTEEQKKQQTIQWIVTLILMLVGIYNHLALINNMPHIEIVDEVITRYVTWGYETVVGIYAFWINNNITSPAQLVQVLLNELKNSQISTEQVDLLIRIVDSLIKGELTTEQLKEFVENPELKEIANAHLDGQTVEVTIQESE